MSLIFVDCEAGFDSPCPDIGTGLTEFGAVEYKTRCWFHGKPYNWVINSTGLCELTFGQASNNEIQWYDTLIEFERWLHNFESPYIFVSDNPAYDWQWINYHFHHSLGRNPFGHSARRIGDFYAGLVGDLRAASKWKKLRITPHTHNPVMDALGNVESMEAILKSLDLSLFNGTFRPLKVHSVKPKND